jgi:type I restriction enzyme S subunit
MKKGWQTKNLGDLCDVVGGGTPPKDKPAFYSGDIPWATVRDMRQDVMTETEFRITKDAVKSSATNIIPSGNVVIATRVGLGKVCLIGQDTAINQDLRGIVPRSDKALVVRYLYWWLKSIADVIVAEGTGATVQGVKLPFVKSLQIPVPPLTEQQRMTYYTEVCRSLGLNPLTRPFEYITLNGKLTLRLAGRQLCSERARREARGGEGMR